MNPGSEHKIIQHWNKTVYDEYVEGIELQHLYRTVGILSGNKEKIESALFERKRNLFNQEIDLAFFDTTSTYLNGTISEEIAQYGYSKDKRPDKKQVIAGVLMGSDNLPIGCEMVQGNTTDVKAMEEIIKGVKTRFSIRKIILVGDGGMNSEGNRELIKKENMGYIFGTRIRNCKAIKDYLKNSQPIEYDMGIERDGKNGLKRKELKEEGKRYAIVYNGKEAERERKSREEIIEKLKKRLAKGGIKGLIKNKGQKKYIKLAKNKTADKKGKKQDSELFKIDYEKIREEEKYDGLFVCETDNMEMEIGDVVMQYKNLWQVEAAFRNLKDVIEMRPIYHKNDDMIKGHIFASFLGLYADMYLKKMLADNGIKDAEEIGELMAEARAIKAIKIKVKDTQAVMRTELGMNVNKLFTALNMRPPDRIIEKWEIGKM